MHTAVPNSTYSGRLQATTVKGRLEHRIRRFQTCIWGTSTVFTDVLCMVITFSTDYDLPGAGGTRGDESALPLALSGARSCPLAQPSEIALIERPLAAAVEALDHQLRLLLGEG